MVAALIQALRNEVRGADKGMPKHSPGAFQNIAQHVPDPSKKSRLGTFLGTKMSPRSLQTGQERPRSAQEPSKKRPRGTQGWPRAPKSRPTHAQESPKRGPNPSRIDPDEPRDKVRAGFCGKLCSAGSGSDFMSFFGSCDKLAICKNLRKIMEKLWF